MATDIPDIPDRIGLYEIVKLIGRGGMGLTLLAMRKDMGKPCVLKLMLPELAAVPKFREMFSNEAYIGAQLGHKGIVSVFDCGEHDGRLYLVMERIDGVNLDELLKALRNQKAGPLGLSLVVYIIGELLEAVGYAHGRIYNQLHDIGVIHHDIKPGNIMISSYGEVRLTDFGIARYVDESGRESKPIGTLLYMAPEQLMGRVTRQSDLYSLGVVLHELLTGSPPLGKVPESMRREALLIEPIPPTGRDDVPRELEELRVALLQKHPEKRLRSAEEGLGMLKLCRGPDRDQQANAVELRDLYLRLIGPHSSGWTGYVRSAEQRGEEPAIPGPWIERVKSVPRKPIEEQPPEPGASAESDRLYWAHDQESGEGKTERLDDHQTRPWEASPPKRDANVADVPGAPGGAEAPPALEMPRTEDIRTRRHRRVLPRRSKDNGTGPEGRIEAPLRRRKAVLQPAAVAVPSPDSPAASKVAVPSAPAVEDVPHVKTDVLPPPTRGQDVPATVQIAASRTEVAVPPVPDVHDDGQGHGQDRTRRIVGAGAAFLAPTVVLLHGSGCSESVDDVQACEVTS